MDGSQLALAAVAFLTPLTPYLAKAGEEVAKEVGRAVFEKARAVYSIIRQKFEAEQDDESRRALTSFEPQPTAYADRLVVQLTQKAETDQQFAQALAGHIRDLRDLLLHCLEERFLLQDLKKVYFLIGIGWNDLVGEAAGRAEKAMALIEYADKHRERLPDLIRAMWETYPGLKC